MGKAERGILPALDGSFGFLLCGENSNDFFILPFMLILMRRILFIRFMIYNLKLNYVCAVTSYSYVFFLFVFFLG